MECFVAREERCFRTARYGNLRTSQTTVESCRSESRESRELLLKNAKTQFVFLENVVLLLLFEAEKK